MPLAEAENSRFVSSREADGVREHVAIVIGDARTGRGRPGAPALVLPHR